MIRHLFIALVFTAGTLTAAEESAVPKQRVGQPLEIREIYIAGAEVKPKPRRDRKPPLVVRVLEVKPAKDGFRYDFEVQGLDPGRHNLAEYLDAPEGVKLPAIPLEITSDLAPGLVRPHPATPNPLPELGGYRAKMVTLSVLWVAGLIGILLWRKKKPGTTGASEAPPSLAERLRPLVDQASKGELSNDDRAKLERLIIGHWREQRPDIASLAPAEAMMKLRSDPEAAPLVLALERWLHARSGEISSRDLEQLLAPYAR